MVACVVDRSLDNQGGVFDAGRVSKVGRLGHVQATQLQQGIIGIDTGRKLSGRRVHSADKQAKHDNLHRHSFHRIFRVMHMPHRDASTKTVSRSGSEAMALK